MSTEDRLRDYLALATDELRRANQRLRELESAGREPIAIIAAACRFPGGADTPEELWRLVSTGGEATTPFPRGRGRDLNGGSDSGRSQLPRGGFLADAAQFDPTFFGISPREATALDPQQRLLLETAWEAIERAAIVPADLRGRDVGVFAGVTHNEYGSPLSDAPADLEGLMLTGTTPSVASGRIAYTLGLSGPAVTIDTACSSSLVAIHLAIRSLRERECALALAGGAAVMTNTGMFDEFGAQHGLAADGRCKPFSDDADGTAWSEGAGLVLLERLSDAVANGHPVLAVIRGSAINQDGASNGLTAPRGAAQEEVIRRALADAGLTAADVDVVEAHGTGTALGDPIEAHALLSAYGRDRAADRPLLISAIKSSIGHTQAAAGVAGVIAMVMAMRAGSLPWMPRAGEPSRHVDWSAGGVSLLTRPTPWITRDQPRRAGVSSFGISGTNAHLILEEAAAQTREADSTPPVDLDPPAPVAWLVSGASDAALRAQARALLEHVRSQPRLRAQDIGYSLAATRSVFEHRAAIIGANRSELESGLTDVVAGRAAPNVLRSRSGNVTRTAFLFSGQGSQRPGMGAGLYRTYPVFARALDSAMEVFDPHLERPLREIFFAGAGAGDRLLLDDTAYTQPALFALEVALYRLVESFNLGADYLIGHSIGELAAAHVAGVFSLEDAARLVAARGRLMAATPAGAMASIEASEDEVRSRLAGWDASLAIAAVNSPASTVVSGAQSAVEAFAEQWRALGRKATRLRVRNAFHSPAMDAILGELAEVVKTLTPRPPEIPMLSNVTGTMAGAELCDPKYWADQARSAVRFMDGVRKLAAEGVDSYLELGPAPILTPLVLQTVGSAPVCVSALTRGEDEPRAFLTALAELHVHGAAPQWPKQSFGEGCATVELPTYRFQRRPYWLRREQRASDGPQDGPRSSSGHPLLGRRVELAGAPGQWFAQTFGTDRLPTLAQHRLLDRPVLPAAAMVEWTVACVRAASDQDPGQEVGLPLTVHELVFAEFLPLPEQGAVAAQAAARVQDDRIDVRCFARPVNAPGEPWTEHVTAWAATSAASRSDDQAAAAAEDAPRIEALRAELDALPVETFYARWERMGLRYGPAFRGVREVLRSGGTALALIETPRSADDGAGHVLLHPATLDSCFQLFAAFQDERAGGEGEPHDRDDAVWVPVSLEHLTVYRPLPDRLWCRAGLRASAQDGERVVDLMMLTESGDVLAVAQGLRFHAVSRPAVQRSIGSELRQIEVEWMAVDDGDARPAVDARRGPWLVFSDQADLARRWRAELAASGVPALALVADSATGSGDDESEIPVDPDSAQSVHSAIAALRERGLTPGGLILHAGRPAQSPEADSALDESALDESAVDEAYRLARRSLHLLQGFLTAATDEAAEVLLCSTGAASTGDEAHPPKPGQAVFTAMAKAVIAEYPDLKVVQIDLDPGAPEPPVAEVVGRAAAHRAAGHLAVRGGQWYQATLRERAVTGSARVPVRPDATYLITGGLGALGLEVASWLARQGAGTLLLVGRTLPPQVAAHLDAMRAAGAQVECRLVDIADADAVARLFEDTRRDLPPLRGVVHAAGTLDDGALTELSWERFSRVLDPKVRGSWLLHQHTKDLDLDFFVLFSSLVSLTGAAGQSDYLVANSFMDAVAQARRQEGRPALSVGWGPWTGAGMAAQRGLLQRFAAMGVAGFPAGPALEALARLTAGGTTPACAGIAAVDWSRYTAALSRRQPYSLLSGVSPSLEAPDSPGAASPVRIAELAHAALTDPETARESILSELLDRVAALLHIPAAERDELRAGFAATRLSALGLDSLTTIQLRGRLLADFGTDIAPSVLFGSSTAARVAEAIREQMAVRAVIAGDTASAADDDDAETEVLTL